MERIIRIFAAIVLTSGMILPGIANAQAPQKMTYQAVVRNVSNELVSNTQVGIQIRILQGSVSGTIVYEEEQSPLTNSNGLLTIEIGEEAGFDAIDWADGPYFISTGIDPEGGINYSAISGTSQLLSVPYALHANTAESIPGQWTKNGNNIYYNNGLVGIGNTTPVALLDIYDDAGYPFFKFTSTDNVYTQWISNRTGVDDYMLGIDGGNNRFNIANLTQSYFPVTIHGKYLGIGTYTPVAPLHITDFMKLEPRDSDPPSGTEGMIYYNSTDHKLKVCTGSGTWEDLNP